MIEILYTVSGIASASGLFYDENRLYIVSDSATFLYEYNPESGKLEQFPLKEESYAEIPKKHKPDFESLTSDAENFYITGSGSTENRNLMITVSRESKQVTATNDLILFYAAMRKHASISMDDFNIEGVIKSGATWYFFQRGNGPGKKNGIFTAIIGDNFRENFTIDYNPIKLPEISGCPYSFTDAILVDETIWFLAAAESSASTYHDGIVLGSIIGTINLKNMSVGKTIPLSSDNKFEGLTLYKKDAGSLEFLLCDDNDTGALQSAICRIKVSKG